MEAAVILHVVSNSVPEPQNLMPWLLFEDDNDMRAHLRHKKMICMTKEKY